MRCLLPSPPPHQLKHQLQQQQQDMALTPPARAWGAAAAALAAGSSYPASASDNHGGERVWKVSACLPCHCLSRSLYLTRQPIRCLRFVSCPVPPALTTTNSTPSSPPNANGPLSAHRSGGGGGGKSSKEKRRERGRGSGASSSSSSSSPAQSFSSSFSPPADADEMPMLYDKDGVETTGAMGNKPAQWPNKVRREKLVWAGARLFQFLFLPFRS